MSVSDRSHIRFTMADNMRKSFGVNRTMTPSACRTCIGPPTFNVICWQGIGSRTVDKPPIAKPHSGAVERPIVCTVEMTCLKTPGNFTLVRKGFKGVGVDFPSVPVEVGSNTTWVGR